MSFLKKLFGQNKEPESLKPDLAAPPPPVSPRRAPQPASNDFYPPFTRIAGRYEVISHPLMGGMGIVYLCNDLQKDRPVALKTFRPELLPDRAARGRFLKEGQLWVTLGAYPHVVQCYEVFYQDPVVFLVLELVAKNAGREDASLHAWMEPGKGLAVETTLLFALQVVRGMVHACEKIPGFVHRDLKPENLLVGADRLTGWKVNRLRITDFGLAKALALGDQPSAVSNSRSNLSSVQHTHGIVGTPYYMAPEQWQPGAAVSTATDVYALGCILYEMLNGRRAFDERSLPALQRAHCAAARPLLDSKVPGAAAQVVTRCLAVEAGERYGEWGDVEEALAGALQDLEYGAAPRAVSGAELGRAERVWQGWSQNAMGASYLDMGHAEAAAERFVQAQEIGRAEGEREMEGAALGNLGLVYADLGDARQAISYYEQALVIAREIGDRSGEVAALGNLGNAYADLSDAQRAISYCEQQLVIMREIGDRRGEGAALVNLGLAYADLSDARRAIGYYEQALAIDREIGDRRGEGAALVNLGLAYADLSDDQRAIGYYEQSLVIDREIGNRRGEGAALGNLGVAYKNLGNARRAIECYEQALAIDREIGNRRGEGNDLGNLGNAYSNLGDAQRAIEYYEQALVILREIGGRREAAVALCNLGNAYADLRDARRAIGYYEQALVIDREIGDRRGEGDDLGNLGLTYVDLGDTRRAIGYYEQQLVIVREIDDRRREGAVLDHLGRAYARLGDDRQAIGYYEQQLEIALEIGDRSDEGNALGNLGNAYARLGDDRQAIGYYEQRLEITRQIGDQMGEATASFNMARLYFQQRQPERALPLAQHATRLYTQTGHARHAQMVQELVADFQGGGAPPAAGGPAPEEILAGFAPLIEAAVLATRGSQAARRAVEDAFGQLEQNGWRVPAPIRRIWAGERDAAALTQGLDPNSALIVSEVLRRV